MSAKLCRVVHHATARILAGATAGLCLASVLLGVAWLIHGSVLAAAAVLLLGAGLGAIVGGAKVNSLAAPTVFVGPFCPNKTPWLPEPIARRMAGDFLNDHADAERNRASAISGK